MKRRIYNLIIIDESGSMHAIKQQAIDNINETIQTIRHLDPLSVILPHDGQA